MLPIFHLLQSTKRVRFHYVFRPWHATVVHRGPSLEQTVGTEENLFMLLIVISQCRTALLFSISQRTSPLLVPVSCLRPEFSVDGSQTWAETAKIFFAICLVIFVGCIQTTDLLHPICCPAKPSWSRAKCRLAQHMCKPAVIRRSFFFFFF